jgi:hypothetical protein
MSIATLKKKTLNNSRIMSTGKPAFSINGGYRNQGYIGQTSLSRSLPRTLMNGPYERGHGEMAGYYNITPIVQSAVSSQEDNTIIKPSVLSSKGMMRNKYKWTQRPQPYSTTKPDSNHLSNTQGLYIDHLSKTAIQCIPTPSSKEEGNVIVNTNGSCPVKCSKIVKKMVTKPGISTQSYGEYIKTLTNGCSSFDEYVFPTLTNRTPLPSNV